MLTNPFVGYALLLCKMAGWCGVAEGGGQLPPSRAVLQFKFLFFFLVTTPRASNRRIQSDKSTKEERIMYAVCPSCETQNWGGSRELNKEALRWRESAGVLNIPVSRK